MHVVGDEQTWDLFPPTQHANDAGDRSDAYRAIGVSVVGHDVEVAIQAAVPEARTVPLGAKATGLVIAQFERFVT